MSDDFNSLNWITSQQLGREAPHSFPELKLETANGHLSDDPTASDRLLLAVVAVGVGAATVAVVDEAGGGHPEGLCGTEGYKTRRPQEASQRGSESASQSLRVCVHVCRRSCVRGCVTRDSLMCLVSAEESQ